MPDTEPARSVAYQTALAKIVASLGATVGLAIGDQQAAAIATAAAGVLAVVFSLVQGRVTRARVFAPATVEAISPGSTGADVLSVPFSR